MPEIKITQVKGFSCQDEKYPAENIMTGGKWLVSSSRQSTSMSATFQLAECCTISSVHIGNCGSAFISLCVSRTGCSDMKDLLPCSALMTMQESKNGQNKNSVKIYNKGDFLEESRDGKWDQLRVVVTQPFNLHMQFGLCFLHVFSFHEEGSKDIETFSDFPKWEKLKNDSNSSLSSDHRLNRKSLTRRDRLFLEAGQQPIHLPEKQTPVNKKETEIEFNEAVFEASALSFLESLNLADEDLDNIQLIDLRKKMEKVQGREFCSQERHIFVNCVKKFVSSLKSSKSHSSEKSPYFNRSSKASNSKSGKLNGYDTASSSGWLKAKKDDSSDSDTEKVPSGRRNVLSLEDVNEGEKTGHLISGSSCPMSKELKCATDARSVYLNKRKMLKRKSSPPDGGSIRKFLAVEDNKTKIDVDDLKAESCESSSRELVQCPICTVYFEPDFIEKHSAECNTFIEKDDECSIIPDVTCPVCCKQISSAAADIHAIRCASEMFGD